MQKVKILFVCIHNSARSQIAEAFLNHFGGDKFEAFSAGFEPKDINPLAIEIMREVEIDISQNKSKSVFEMFKEGKKFNYVITVCDEGNAKKCPIFPGVVKRIHWSFKDPSTLSGTKEEITKEMREIRDKIKNHIMDFINGYEK
jgi:arsenate reductase (thioredoxin)